MSRIKMIPSGWYYVLAGLVLIGGLVGSALFVFSGYCGLGGDLAQMVVPGQHELTLSGPGEYTVFNEYWSVVGNEVYETGRKWHSGLRCNLSSKATGEQIPLSPAAINLTYYRDSRSGVAVFDFSVDSPGAYLFSARYPAGQEGPEVVLTVGHGLEKQRFALILGGLGIVFGSLGAAIAIAVITFVKRRGARRRLEAGLI